MKIRKLPSGNYNAQIVVGRKADGTRNVKSITAKTEWEVMKRTDEFIRLNKDMNPDSISVKEALISYIDSKRHVIAPTTLYGYESLAKNRLLSIQGHMLFSEVLHCSLVLNFRQFVNLSYLRKK